MQYPVVRLDVAGVWLVATYYRTQTPDACALLLPLRPSELSLACDSGRFRLHPAEHADDGSGTDRSAAVVPIYLPARFPIAVIAASRGFPGRSHSPSPHYSNEKKIFSDF